MRQVGVARMGGVAVPSSYADYVRVWPLRNMVPKRRSPASGQGLMRGERKGGFGLLGVCGL